MQKDWLFPHRFRRVGWLVFFPTLLAGILLSNFDMLVHEVEKVTGDYWDELVCALLIISLVLVGFTREKVEDEMIKQVRLESLQWATYVHYGCLLLAIIFFYDLAFFRVMVYTMFAPLIVFIGRYAWMLHRLRKPNNTAAVGGIRPI